MFISSLDVEDGLRTNDDGGSQDGPLVDCWGRTALHVAVMCKQKEVMKCFINHSGMCFSIMISIFICFFVFL